MKAHKRKGRLKQRIAPRVYSSRVAALLSLLLVLSLSHAGCFSGEEPTSYYGKLIPPREQQFRWSDGGLPQTFDPAFAAAAPDTDVVRAIFEGLTDYDPRTLTPIPAVASRWESSNDGRVWTFYLRDDAHWSNGEKVTASDFVRSWERTVKIGPLAPHTELLSNIVGAVPSPVNRQRTAKDEPSSRDSAHESETHLRSTQAGSLPGVVHFGAQALSDGVLRVELQHGDLNFPALVAHPVFRPVKVNNADMTKRLGAAELISNGAFSIAKTDANRVLLERAKNYWDDSSVSLQRVEFVNAGNAEDALAAYRAGEIDAVTSAPFEPLALKLLAPYKDFRRSTFGALTYYSFNTAQSPFDDVRVREALSIAIDRERISRDDLGGATEPAQKFLPEEMSANKPVIGTTELLDQDVRKAKELLIEAGYPNGRDFRPVRLLINRNEQQRIVAQAIAAMWHSALNIETEIIVKSWDEYEVALKAGEYDVVRRGLVMQTTDQLTNLRMLFHDEEQTPLHAQNAAPGAPRPLESAPSSTNVKQRTIDSESEALKQLRAMPIYFASSYALVKPYVSGFDGNVLDAPSLKKTRIDTSWTERGSAGR